MAYDEDLAVRVRICLSEHSGVVERKMFGGLCFMAHGNMLGGVMDDEIIVRVGADEYEDALQHPHAREMDFTGRPMRGFVVVGPAGISTDAALTSWLDRALSFALSLPPK